MWIRTASERDLQEIRALLVNAWHDTYDSIYGADKVSEINEDWHSLNALKPKLTQPDSEFILADAGEGISGMAFASTRDGKVVDLHQLYVLPQSQGQGVGTLLLDEIENCFAEAKSIRLEVEETNAKALAFYEKAGFHEVGRTDNCGVAGSGLPALVLEKNIP
ncbi:MAG: GNAT family N-acetyltransferase [Rhizobiaceae bacterium]|nr:GNAT family N-acetyltransferase [Rhizobiaceae bacterium]|tara:strand:+ start:14430 stop:14918 length:489 start_codon:yes stop_codon:yes gene_type:complete